MEGVIEKRAELTSKERRGGAYLGRLERDTSNHWRADTLTGWRFNSKMSATATLAVVE